MSEYFSYFPKIDSDLLQTGNTVKLTNVLKRFSFTTDVKKRTEVFYEYNVQAGDRPDTIAEKYYGDADLAWVVTLFNNIDNPITDWALFNQDFDAYIKGKYGSIPNAQSTIHEYRQILREAEVKYDGTRISKKYVVIDESTYNGLDESVKESISKYDYEIELNEEKRQINLIDKRYLPKIREEVKFILKDNG